MAYLLDRIKESLQKEGLPARSIKSRDWIRTKVQNLNSTPRSLMSDKQRLKNDTVIGKLYFYSYNPKTKDKMKYYDKFPLVIPLEMYNDGFLGLNLHYIHPKQRLLLLDKLSEYATNDKYDKTTKLRLSYSLLKSAAKVYEMQACIKRYLYTNIESRFLEVPADEWDIAALLPYENFVGARPSQVFSDSREKF